eukprot:COSAG01_NODE_1230_length_11112_cov_6.312511_9_plen_27_part_01
MIAANNRVRNVRVYDIDTGDHKRAQRV